MLWIVFIAGIFLGANVGIVVTCIMVSAKKRDAMECEHKNWIKCAVLQNSPGLSDSM
jgi:hypothetical protein